MVCLDLIISGIRETTLSVYYCFDKWRNNFIRRKFRKGALAKVFTMTPHPFRLAKWILDKFWYWLGWSLIFLGLMFVLTSVGSSRELFIAYSFGSFWITTALMNWMRERWNGKLRVGNLGIKLTYPGLDKGRNNSLTRNHRKGAGHRGIRARELS